MTQADQFVAFLLRCGVLKFGQFTTKSGRQTPYFINTGEFRRGPHMSQLARFYAEAIKEQFPDITNLYGPAYKGIPLATAIAMALADQHDLDVSYTFNRKEAKDHGEGGVLVGQKYDQTENVLITEDVITAGTSVNETMEAMTHYPNANVQGLIIAVDRKEKVDSGKSAVQEVQSRYNLKVHALITIDDIINFVSNVRHREKHGIEESMIDAMHGYRETYGIG